MILFVLATCHVLHITSACTQSIEFVSQIAFESTNAGVSTPHTEYLQTLHAGRNQHGSSSTSCCAMQSHRSTADSSEPMAASSGQTCICGRLGSPSGALAAAAGGAAGAPRCGGGGGTVRGRRAGAAGAGSGAGQPVSIAPQHEILSACGMSCTHDR